MEQRVQAVMDDLGVSREAAALLVAIETGVALVGDVVFDPPLSREEMYRRGISKPIEERIELARRQVQAREQSE